MRFPYLNASMGRPIVSLNGRTTRPRAIVGVSLLGPLGSVSQDALLDTGADDTVFPDHLAASLGIDLSTALQGNASGVGGRVIPVYFASVRLRLADQYERREWPALVAFASLGNSMPMLGFAGCLQYFTATFHGDREIVELTVNTLYPGI